MTKKNKIFKKPKGFTWSLYKNSSGKPDKDLRRLFVGIKQIDDLLSSYNIEEKQLLDDSECETLRRTLRFIEKYGFQDSMLRIGVTSQQIQDDEVLPLDFENLKGVKKPPRTIYELKNKNTKNNPRFLVAKCNENKFVFLYGWAKKTSGIPDRVKELAVKRVKQLVKNGEC